MPVDLISPFYGTFDAALLRQECLTQQLTEIGLVRVWRTHACSFMRIGSSACCSIGGVDQLEWLKAQLEARFGIEHSRRAGKVTEGKILNRIIGVRSAGWNTSATKGTSW